MSGIALQESETDLRTIVRAINQIMQGRSNAVGQVTLTPNSATTIVTKLTHPAVVNMSKDSEVFFSALTDNAAAVSWSLVVFNKIQGGFSIRHVNNAAVDKTFGFQIAG